MTTAQYIALYACFHALCGWLAWELIRWSWKREFGEYSNDPYPDILTALCGPLGLLAAAVFTAWQQSTFRRRAYGLAPKPDRTQPPPGWTIVVNQFGEHAAKNDTTGHLVYVLGCDIGKAVSIAWEEWQKDQPKKWTPLPK